jgi:transposase
MTAMTIGVDLAKNVFQLAVADSDWRIIERHRLTRAKFSAFFVQRNQCKVILEACGSSHHWARYIRELGHEVQLLPAQYVRAYVKRNKTDEADAAALIEAARCADIKPVPVKSIEQQQVQALHRVRSQWLRSRHRYINMLRGILREFGIPIALGIKVADAQIGAALADDDNALPAALRPTLASMLDEIRAMAAKLLAVDRDLGTLSRMDERTKRLREIPGIGPLTSSAIPAIVGDIQRFPSARHFSSWLGLTATERSSAEQRRLGRISKQGDVYLRTLIVHGARAVLQHARRAKRCGKQTDRLRTWALTCEDRRGHNKATVALANRLARIVWATWKHNRPYDGDWLSKAA